MIKINLTKEKLDLLSANHYSKLNKFLLTKIYDIELNNHFEFNDVEYNEDFYNIGKNDITKKILDYIKNNIYKIIISEPDDLININQEFLEHINIKKEKQNTAEIYYSKNGKTKLKKTLFNIVSKVFDYQSFSKKNINKYNAYELAMDLGVQTCLYCNRISTITVLNNQSNDKGKFICRPEFDHFFIKSKYPLLALSFYNLIPSCTICNCTLKGETDFLELNDNDDSYIIKYLHPYQSSFGENNTKFMISKIWNMKIFIGDKTSYKVEWDSSKALDSIKIKIDNNKVLFKLNEIYTEECSFKIEEILNRSIIYSDEYILSLVNFFEKNNINDISAEKVYKQLFNTEYMEEKHQNIPLSKMNYDLNEYFMINQKLKNITKENNASKISLNLTL